MPSIVILDDRGSNRQIYSRLAATLGEDVRVEVFCDPEGALTWLHDHKVSLIITDFKMPGMNGAEFIRRFRAMPDTGNPAIIVITVYEERSFRLQALEAGATDFLISPVDHYEFIARARNLLAHHAMLAQNSHQIENLEQRLAQSQPLHAHALCSLSETLGQIIETVPVLLSATGLDGTILFVNARQAEASGVDAALVTGQPATALFGPLRGLASHERDRLVLHNGESVQEEERVNFSERDHASVLRTTKSILKNASGDIIGVLTCSIDITPEAEQEDKLRWNELHDPVSGLPNRLCLVRHIEHQKLSQRRAETRFALHRFEGSDDAEAHKIMQRLASHLRGDDILAHFGGSDFCILQSRINNAEEAAQFSRKINLVLSNDQKIGVALHPEDGNLADKLIKFAEKDMYWSMFQYNSHAFSKDQKDFSDCSKKDRVIFETSHVYAKRHTTGDKKINDFCSADRKIMLCVNDIANDNNKYLERCD